jgi:phage terminase large subunit-like protein
MVLPPNAGVSDKTAISQIRAQQLLADYRLTPATLMARIDPSYIASKWVLYLSMKIAQCVARGSCGLLISAPPRHGNSMLATIATPLWVLENYPQHNIGVVTYGEDLSTDFSRQIRDHVQNNQNLLSVRLRQDVTRVSNFLTTAGGGLKAVGLRGTITGRGFHVLVIDDYIKEPKEAESANYLEGLYTWYQTVARTRLEPGAVIIIVATRWTKNDLHGKLMKLQAMTGRNFFEVVSLPALAYDPLEVAKLPLEKQAQLLGYPDPLHRAPGEPLFPERYSRADMENMRAEMQGRWWNAMFQQNPFGDEGTVIDPTMFYKVEAAQYQAILRDLYNAPANYKVGRYWDMASSKNQGDYTVGARGILCLKTTSNMREGDFLIDHVVRGQMSPAKAESTFKAICSQDTRSFPMIQFGMEEEPGSSGKYSIRHFQGILNKVSPHHILKAENSAAKGSKLLAAGPYVGQIEKGKVGVYQSEWNQDFYDEHESFPEGMNDDQVDGSSGCYRLVKGLIGQSPVWGRSAEAQRLSGQMSGGRPLPADIANRVSATWGKRPSGLIVPGGMDTEGFQLPPGMEMVEG